MGEKQLDPVQIERAKALGEIEAEWSRIGAELASSFGDMHQLLRKHTKEDGPSVLDVHRMISAADVASREAGERIIMAFLKNSR